MILADKIIRLRKKNGWSQEELAEKMNVSRQAVSKWESSQSTPDLEKILQLSKLFGVTTDYLLKDEIENEEHADGISNPSIRKITLAEANEYLEQRKKASGRIAIATLLCIVAIFPLLLLGTASENPAFAWSEELACGVGLISIFPIVAIAVAIFIRVGFANAPYDFIEQQPFETEYGVVGLVKDAQEKYRSTYVKLNCIGACICVLSPIPLLCAAFTNHDLLIVIMLTLTMFLAGIGAMFFIVAGVRWASMQKLLKEGEYRPTEKKKRGIKETVGLVYWLVVTAVFFLWSFLGNDAIGIHGNPCGSWQYNWVIWPVAGVLFVAVMMVCNLIVDKKNKE